MSTTLDPALVTELAGQVSGSVLGPEDAGYDAARAVHNGLIDRKPALIVRCRTTGDVVAALALARRAGLEVSIRGGGHNVAGRAVTDGGVMIDLAEMKGIAIDPEQATATAEGGATWGELNDAAAAHGLAVTGGAISTTGIAGYTLGGGLGWLMAKYGLAADNLLAVELVTAEGEVLDVDAASHPDLFWALRGGGGNFGVATSFTYRMHPLSTIVGGLIAHPIDAAPDLLRFYRDAVADGSDDLTVFAGLVHAPDGSGAKLSALVVFHTGDADEAERDLEPFKTWGSPLMVEVGPMPYPVMNTHPRRRLPGRIAQLLAVELHARHARRADRHHRRTVCHRPVTDDGDPVRALPRRGDTRRGDRDRSAAPRRGVEPPHPVRLDGPGRHRRKHRVEPRDVRSDATAFRDRPLAQLPRRRPGRGRHPRGLRPELRPAPSKSSGGTTRTTSSTSTTTSCPRSSGPQRVAYAWSTRARTQIVRNGER